jgi:hypothetical protein
LRKYHLVSKKIKKQVVHAVVVSNVVGDHDGKLQQRGLLVS